MSCHLNALSIDANHPQRLARFWSGLLGCEISFATNVPTLLPNNDTGFRVRFLSTREPKVGPNQMHFDLTSTSLADQNETVGRALELGAHRLDIGQGPDATHVVLSDPEGNEFCVIEPGNRFLAECGFIGALASEGSREVGYFWSAALSWPLVWNQDEETAIRSPFGGPTITWGGPPLTPKSGKYRMHFDLAPDAGCDQQSEVDRLLSLGADYVDIEQGDVGWIVMVDPDGHEFCVLSGDAMSAIGERP